MKNHDGNNEESREERILRLIKKWKRYLMKLAHQNKGWGAEFEALLQFGEQVMVEVCDKFPDDDGAVEAYLHACLPGRMRVEASQQRGFSGQVSFDDVEVWVPDYRTQYDLEQVDLDLSLERSLSYGERRLLSARLRGGKQREIAKRRKRSRQTIGAQEQKLRKKLLAILKRDTPEVPGKEGAKLPRGAKSKKSEKGKH